MKMNSLIFVIAFIVSFAGGYFFFTAGDTPDKNSVETSTTTDEKDSSEKDKEGVEESAEQATVPAEAEALSRNNCLSCHAVESLGVEGGNSGPDLSNAFSEVEGKHGKEIDAFLQEPTSAVMSSVIEGNPLEDEERSQIIEVLKKAAEQ